MFGLKNKKRQRTRNRPFPQKWQEILEKNVAYYHHLTPADQAELREHIQVFLDEKDFEGCGGQEINDEIRVVIAAQACILLLHRETDYYPRLNSILVYPHHYFSNGTRRLPGRVFRGGVVTEAFFEKPIQLKHRHPSLYEQLNLFYQQDPARRFCGNKKSR